MDWIDYDGQDLEGYDYIGTETMRVPIANVTDVDATVRELQRVCGRHASIKLYKESVTNETRRYASC